MDCIEEEQVRQGGRPLHLSEPSKTWVDRVWHAMIDTTISDDEFERVDALFIAYLDGLDDEEEERKAEGVLILLAGAAEQLADEWPRCRDCGRPLCPCCQRHVGKGR